MDSNNNCSFADTMQSSEGQFLYQPSPTFTDLHHAAQANDVVIISDVTKHALHRLHVINTTGLVDRLHWVAMVETDAAKRGMEVDWDHAGICAFEDLWKVHHVWIVWKEVTIGA